MPPAMDGDGAGLHRRRMRLAIDAARHAGDDDIAGLAQIARQVARHAPAGCGGVARADHGDGGQVQQVAPAAHGDHRRRRVDGGEAGGIVRLACGQMSGAELLRRVDLALDLVGRGRLDLGLAACLLRERGQVGQHVGGRAIALQQMEEGDRPDPARAREPQPVRPLCPVVAASRLRHPHPLRRRLRSAARCPDACQPRLPAVSSCRSSALCRRGCAGCWRDAARRSARRERR